MIYFKLLIFILFTSLSSNATNISVVNIDELISTNKNYIKIIKEIEDSQKKYHKNFKIKEEFIDNIYKDIENSKLLLNDNERNKLINEYNTELDKLNNLVNNFNIHYQNEIINIRNIILKEIIELLEIYATVNEVDLIMDSTNYLIASNDINITSYIKKQLDLIELDLGYKNFDKN